MAYYSGAPIAWRIANGPYLATSTTLDISATLPVSTTYWDGTAYVTSLSYGRIAPGQLIAICSPAVRPEVDTPLNLLTVLTVKSVTVISGADVVQWYCPYTYDTTGQDYFPSESPPNEPPAQLAADVGLRIEFTRQIGRPVIGGSSDGASVYDYLVLMTQTGETSTEQALAFYGQTETTSSLSMGAKAVPVKSTWGQFIPVTEAGYPDNVPEALLGVDPLPYLATGGRVATFRKGEACVIHHTATTAPMTVSNSQDVNLGRTLLSKVRVFGNDGNEITAGFTPNLATGHVIFGDVSGYSQPVTIQHRIEDMLLMGSVEEQAINTTRGVTHAYPSGAKVSSVMMFGDMQAKVHEGFDQATWTSVWSDTLIGSNTAAEFNEAATPITVTNRGALTERWAIIFTGSTTFKVVGEQVGEILTGNTGTDTAPLNPATLAPYFTIPAAGWGSGWSAGNVYRFNTDGANAPVWLIRSIAPSDPFVGQDSMTVAIRGNVDA